MTSRSPNCGPRCSCRLIGEGRCSRLGATAPDLRSGGRFLASAQSGQARFCARFTKTPASVQTARRGRRPEGLPPAASTSGRSRLFLRRRPAKKARTPQSSSRKIFSDLSFEERAKEDREAKIVGKPPHASLNDHERLRFCGAKRGAASTVAARQSPRAASALACCRRLHDRSGRSVCGGFFVRHFHIAGSCGPAACRE